MANSDQTTRPMGGTWGRVREVDLHRGASETIPVSNRDRERFLGGLGFAARFSWERIPAGADPLGPDNILGFFPGLLTDTGALFSGRFLVTGRSPQSGGWGESNCGGTFAPHLKRCGVDGLLVRGCSERPVYLLVTEEGAEVRDAGDLWGLDTQRTEALLKDRHGARSQVACIGPAGEKQSYMAGIANDGGRMAARSGLGAVMGSKRVKAVVVRGKAKVPVADPARMKVLSREFARRLKAGSRAARLFDDRALGLVGWLTRVNPVQIRQPADVFRLIMMRYGTPSITAMAAESGDSPVRNWAGAGCTDFPLSRSQKLGAEKVQQLEARKYGCHACPLRCGGVVQGGTVPDVAEEMHKPEYETLCAFGALILNDDLASICRINDRLNRAGMDTISCGGVVSFAIECFQNGVLTREDLDGIDLDWGRGDSVVALVDRIVAREGIGDVLADGVREAARRIGPEAEPYAVHCGGVEAPMHDPRHDPGQLVSYTCDATPGRHTTACYTYLELQELEKRFERAPRIPQLALRRARFDHGPKIPALSVGTWFKMVVDAAGLCLFGTQVGGNMPLVPWIEAATGRPWDPDDVLRVGERIHLLRHAFTVREGLNPIRDFRPHPRVVGEPPLTEGPFRDLTLDGRAMGEAFYAHQRWDPETGTPEPDRVRELDLEDLLEP